MMFIFAAIVAAQVQATPPVSQGTILPCGRVKCPSEGQDSGGVAAISAEQAIRFLCPSHPELVEPVRREAHVHGVRPVLLVAVAKVETGCNSSRVGAKGEQGAWQMLPKGSAARGHGNLVDPRTSAHLAAQHLAKLIRMCGGSEAAALALYSGNRRRCSRKMTDYARKVLGWVKQAATTTFEAGGGK